MRAGDSQRVLQRFSQGSRGNSQPLAVFGDGAAGAFNALLFEHFRNLIVAEWLFHALGADKLLDQRSHRGAGGVAARIGAEAGAKEVLELKGAKRRRHVFGGGDPADGGLVQAELIGNLDNLFKKKL